MGPPCPNSLMSNIGLALPWDAELLMQAHRSTPGTWRETLQATQMTGPPSSPTFPHRKVGGPTHPLDSSARPQQTQPPFFSPCRCLHSCRTARAATTPPPGSPAQECEERGTVGRLPTPSSPRPPSRSRPPPPPRGPHKDPAISSRVKAEQQNAHSPSFQHSPRGLPNVSYRVAGRATTGLSTSNHLPSPHLHNFTPSGCHSPVPVSCMAIGTHLPPRAFLSLLLLLQVLLQPQHPHGAPPSASQTSLEGAVWLSMGWAGRLRGFPPAGLQALRVQRCC